VTDRHRKGASTDESLTGIEAPRVLLLLIKQGGNGLNLTEAQHVILVEPLLSPALEVRARFHVTDDGFKIITCGDSDPGRLISNSQQLALVSQCLLLD
jgi:hypothetical protein